MPLRLSLRPLVRQCRPGILQLRAPFSSTTSKEGLKDIGGPNASRELLGVDRDERSAAPTNSYQDNARADQRDRHDALRNIMENHNAFENIGRTKETFNAAAKADAQRLELAKQMTRNWKPGDVYAPHDLSPAEMIKWKKPKRPSKDIIDMMGINPLDHYKNFSIISEFMTDMGRIKHSRETGLRPVNQRKMAKAIRRAIGMGIHPSTHKHPMILFGATQHSPKYESVMVPLKESNIKYKPK